MENCGATGCNTDSNNVKPVKTDAKHLVIEMVSDFICPWCLVADTRLNKALAETAPGIVIKRRWLPYELNPYMPEEGKDRREYRIAKFGSWERSLELDAQVKAAGRQDGIEFRHDLMMRTPNTRKAHRLTWLAGKEDKANVVGERILKAYFLEGQDIGDASVLASLAAEVGMDQARVSAFLATDEGVSEVMVMEMENARRGVQGVPLVIIGDEAVNSAQHVRVFAEAIKKTLRVQESA